MGMLVAITGLVLTFLNVERLGDSEWTVSILSTASAIFVTVLGFALTVCPPDTNG